MNRNLWATLALALTVGAISLAGPARANEATTLRELRPATFVASLAEIGQQARLAETTPINTRFVQAGNQYTLYLSACTDGLCHIAQIQVCAVTPLATADEANRWNAANGYGRTVAYTNGTLCLETAFHTRDGKVSQAMLRSMIEGLMSNAPPFWAKYGAK